MKRREFIALVGGAVALPVVARAQQKLPVIGFLGSGSPDMSADRVNAFRNGLSESGFVEGRNVSIEYRWTDGKNDQLLTMAADFARRPTAVIVAGGISAALAAKASTATIPIIFTTAVDPVESGLVSSLNRPGGNLTGATNLNLELGPKRLELLHELVPTATNIVLLVNSANPSAGAIETKELQSIVGRIGLRLNVLQASNDFEKVLLAVTRMQASALLIGADGFFNSRSRQLGAFTARHRVPAIQNSREFVVAGGLVSYGGGGGDAYRIAGTYTGRILNGEKPADLPVQRSTKTTLVINLKTAKALGLTVPPTLLARADEVIE